MRWDYVERHTHDGGAGRVFRASRKNLRPPFKAIGWRYGWGLDSNLEPIPALLPAFSLVGSVQG